MELLDAQASTHATLWLRSWHTHTRIQYAFCVLALAALAIAAEGLASLRAKIGRAAGSAGGAGSGNAVWADDAGVGTAGATEPLLGYLTARASTPGRLRVLLAALYAVNVTLAYLLMLAVMTFNVGFFVAIVVGFGIGNFLFADLLSGKAGGGNACCPQP